MNTDKMRTFTPEQMAQCAKDALENWDYESVYPPLNPKEIEDRLEILNLTADECARLWADDTGLIYLDRAFENVWDMLDEFVEATSANISALE